MAATRIVCQHPGGVGYDMAALSVPDAERRIRTIEKVPECCQGPHTIECWIDGAWREVKSDGE